MFTENRLIAEIAQRVVITLLFDLLEAFQDFFERPEAADQFRGALRPDVTPLFASGGCRRLLPGERTGSRDVVARVSRQCEPVNHLSGFDPQDLADFRLIAKRLAVACAARRFQNAHALVDKLEEVFIAGDYIDVGFPPRSVLR